MKHTKGPWARNSRAIQSENLMICTLDTDLDKSSAEAQANANLIAAAPEMLEALEHLERELCEDEFVKHSKDAINKLKKAVKKAKGEL